MYESPSISLRETLHKRFEILETLRENPQRKPELVADVESSRSTIDRAVAELVENGCLENVDGEYHLTPSGRVSYSVHREYIDRMDDVAQTAEVLNENPSLKEMDITFLREAEVHVGDRYIPESTLEPSIERLQNASRLVGLAPIILTSYIDLVEAAVDENGLSAEIIIHRDAVKRLLDFRDSFTEIVKRGDVTLYVTEDVLPYSLWVMEGDRKDTAGVTVHQHKGVQGLLLNESPRAVSWAKDRLESFKEGSVPYRPSEE
ncbi:helix-turn-helix transcriptional regulator [Halopelagius fulvigenes]|uniref:Helix-turn-helix transcriptional regulator n=1 Tax=Halopelagius fulvigenes TaxID=1198324 RepID=A0ABD5TSL7_9EURY